MQSLTFITYSVTAFGPCWPAGLLAQHCSLYRLTFFLRVKGKCYELPQKLVWEHLIALKINHTMWGKNSYIFANTQLRQCNTVSACCNAIKQNKKQTNIKTLPSICKWLWRTSSSFSSRIWCPSTAQGHLRMSMNSKLWIVEISPDKLPHFQLTVTASVHCTQISLGGTGLGARAGECTVRHQSTQSSCPSWGAAPEIHSTQISLEKPHSQNIFSPTGRKINNNTFFLLLCFTVACESQMLGY